MVETMYHIDNRPSCVRFPRGSGYGEEILNDLYGIPQGKSLYVEGSLPARGSALPIGKGRIMKKGKLICFIMNNLLYHVYFKGESGRRHKVCILSIGTRLIESLHAANSIQHDHPDVSVTVVDMRFLKPLDEKLVKEMAVSHDVMITIEEGFEL